MSTLRALSNQQIKADMTDASELPVYHLRDGVLTCFVDGWTFPFACRMLERMYELAESGLLTPDRVVIVSDMCTIEDGHAVVDWACQGDLVKIYVLAWLLDNRWIRRLTVTGCVAESPIMDKVAGMLTCLNCVVLDYTDYVRGRQVEAPLLGVHARQDPDLWD